MKNNTCKTRGCYELNAAKKAMEPWEMNGIEWKRKGKETQIEAKIKCSIPDNF